MIPPSIMGLRTDLAMREEDPGGAAIHTTGSGLAESCRKQAGMPLGSSVAPGDVFSLAQRVYAKGFGPGYVVGCLRGQVAQICDDRRKAQHIGSQDRDTYLSGAWVAQLPAETVARWRARWPGHKSPWSLFPGKSANAYYLGIECIPITGVRGVAAAGPGERFTQATYDNVLELLAVLETRWRWPAGWRKTPRLIGHEDVGILDRSDKGGGWDPGALRSAPYWNWKRIIQDAIA